MSRADPGGLATNLLAVEPGHEGEYRVSDERVLRLLALAAAEWRRGTELIIDWLVEPTGIADGKVYEASDITENGKPKNVFDWSFMRTGGSLDTGVAEAWQLLQTRGKLTPSVRYLVLDGGFSSNFDFPDDSKIRKAKSGAKNPKDYTNGKSCPYHGTDVVLAAMAKVGNEYGTAGPAGPVVSRLIAVGNSLDYWSQMRRLESVAEDERPDVVNLSFVRDVNIGSKHTKTWTDRRMRHVQQTGALIVAAAGMAGDATLDPDSNYGEGDSSTSVEIFGPMCVRTINDPNRSALDYTTRQVCGTSVASPFVGGVAALVMAADPDLGPEEVRAILNETANVEGPGRHRDRQPAAGQRAARGCPDPRCDDRRAGGKHPGTDRRQEDRYRGLGGPARHRDRLHGTEGEACLEVYGSGAVPIAIDSVDVTIEYVTG